MILLLLCSCNREKPLPLPETESGMRGELGIDRNINEEPIDQYLNRSDTVYRDMRLLKDEADYEAIVSKLKTDEAFRTSLPTGYGNGEANDYVSVTKLAPKLELVTVDVVKE